MQNWAMCKKVLAESHFFSKTWMDTFPRISIDSQI